MRIINTCILLCVTSLLLACGGSGEGTELRSSSMSSSVGDSSSSLAGLSSSVSSSSLAASSTGASSSVSAGLYPNYNTNPVAPDSAGMDSDAMQIASKIKMGINIGNTLEAIGGETNWGNPAISAAYMKLIKDSGFDAVRLPVAWDQYSNQETAEISADWLNRVKQVVQYAVDNELYVIVNIHWDGGWLDENINADMQAATNAKQKAFWEQIATHLRDFDEHLLFASANEPPIEEGDTEGMAILDSYHQTFVDTVRATGGKNAYRVLVVQGPSTNIETTYDLWEQMPNDSVVGRQMAEIHFYGPFNFGLMEEDADWGLMSYYWGEGFHSTTDTERNATWGEEDWVDQQFDLMKTKFVDQGVPVVMGEYGAILRDNLSGDSLALHRASRAYFHLYVTERANSSGILPFVWEIGYSPFPLFDRATPAVADHQLLDALLMGAGKASSSASSTSSSANSSSSSIETSSASSSSSSSMSNEIVLDTSPGRWRVDDGVVKNESASNIEFTLSSADQAGTYDADTPINMANATFNVVLNFDQEFVDNRSGGMDGILQFFTFSPSWEASEYKCWTGWVSLVAGQDITFSCSDFSIEDAVGMGLQFFATEGTVIIKSATIELAN